MTIPILAAIDRLAWTIGFYTFCAVIFLLPCLWQAWKQRSFLYLLVALFFGSAMWFTGPYATDGQRLWTCGLVLAGGIGCCLWFRNKQRGRGVAILLGSLLVLPVVFLNSPNINPIFFEQFVVKMFGFLLAAAFAAVVTFYVLPRLSQKWNAWTALLLSGLGAFGMAIAAFAWWFTAVEMNVYPKNPVVRTYKELEAEYERTKNFPTDRGIFLVGTLAGSSQRPGPGDDPPGEARGDFIAWYSIQSSVGPGSTKNRPHPWFPLWFEVTLEDGSLSEVRGITSARQAFNWKEGGPRNWMVCLRPGDPVVMWGRPVKSKNMTDGREHLGLHETRVAAQGSFDEFMRDYLLPGQITARLFGWIGLGALLFSLLVVPLPGLLRWRWLKKHGGDDPPPAGYQGIAQQWKEQSAARRKK